MSIYKAIRVEVGQVDKTRMPHVSVYGLQEEEAVGSHLRFINAPTLRGARLVAERLALEYEANGEMVERAWRRGGR